MKRTGTILAITALVMMIFGLFTGVTIATPQQPIVEIVAAQDAPPLTEQELTLAQLYENVAPSVVAISVNTRQGDSGGTGFVIDMDGHIVTNFHVVQDASDIIVNFLDGTITRAETVGVDPDADLAVIKVDVDEDRLFPVRFGNSDALVIGQSVAALGSPFGEDWTLTAGIVSALNRRISGLSGYSIGSAIQTDAPINPGNSGGPLFNLSGEVIGVNSQIRSETRANSGIGFAIPSNLTRRVAKELIENGFINYSYIGIFGQAVDLTTIESLELANNQRGVVITDVAPRSPAQEAGFLAPELVFDDSGFANGFTSADIITAIDGEEITGFESLISYLAQYTRPGDTVTMTLLRDNQLIDLPVTLGERP